MTSSSVTSHEVIMFCYDFKCSIQNSSFDLCSCFLYTVVRLYKTSCPILCLSTKKLEYTDGMASYT